MRNEEHKYCFLYIYLFMQGFTCTVKGDTLDTCCFYHDRLMYKLFPFASKDFLLLSLCPSFTIYPWVTWNYSNGWSRTLFNRQPVSLQQVALELISILYLFKLVNESSGQVVLVPKCFYFFYFLWVKWVATLKIILCRLYCWS